MSPDKLAHMANQIGTFFQSQKDADPVAAIADHLTKFWDPRMRRALLANLDSLKLDPPVRQAAERIRTPA
jgi:formate dehydrogenase subunit delta